MDIHDGDSSIYVNIYNHFDSGNTGKARNRKSQKGKEIRRQERERHLDRILVLKYSLVIQVRYFTCDLPVLQAGEGFPDRAIQG